jgi:pimeloyl-ACP methyl ester carboxylesterase
MPKVNVGSVEICYETHGDPAGVPTLLTMGLGMQLIAWDDDFVQLLVDRGHYVIRYDHRDVGESTHLSHLPPPKVMDALMAVSSGQPLETDYSLADMAQDAWGLLEKLGIQSAHLVGVSMGGMISQLMALAAPERTRSLTSIMSTTNERNLPPPQPQALQALMGLMGSGGAPPKLESALETLRVMSSPAFPFNEERLTQRLRRSMQRGFSAAGVGRQFIALVSTPGRGEALRALQVPTLVIHGEDDPLVPLAAGQATAEAIPGAKLLTIAGMGHDLPQPLFETVVNAIVEHAAAANQRHAKN